MKTREPAKNPRSPLAGFSSRRIKQIAPNPRTCEQNQQGSVSAGFSPKTRRLLALYEDDLHQRFAERTAEGYLGHVRFFLAWLQRRGLELASVKTEDLAAHQSDLLALRKDDGRPYSVGFQQNRLSAIKSLFRFLYRRSYLLTDPSAAVDMPRAVRRLPTILTTDEVRRILAAVKGKGPRELRDRAILETFYATGLRVSELRNLACYDVDTEERSLKVRLGKGGKDRMVPLTRPAARAIDAYLAFGRSHFERDKGRPNLFLSDRGLRLSVFMLNRLVQGYAKRARVKKRVTCHTFRHSVATHLLKGRASIRHIQALLGHSSLQSTERYLHLEISDLKDVIARAHPRGR
jgi:integrase/recombinase XerD